MSWGSGEANVGCVCSGSGGMELRIVQGVTKCANASDGCGTWYMFKQYWQAAIYLKFVVGVNAGLGNTLCV